MKIVFKLFWKQKQNASYQMGPSLLKLIVEGCNKLKTYSIYSNKLNLMVLKGKKKLNNIVSKVTN